MQITFIDTAIKSLVVTQKICDKRVYSRSEILRLKEYDYLLPPRMIFDERLMRKSTSRIRGRHNESVNILQSNRERKCINSTYQNNLTNEKFTNSSSSVTVTNRAISKFQTRRYRDRRVHLREYPERNIKPDTTPCWFTEGPKNVEDTIDFNENGFTNFEGVFKLHVPTVEDEMLKENIVKKCDQVSKNKNGVHDKNVSIAVRETSNEEHNHQSNQKLCERKIYTLREIEIDLHVRRGNEENNDMTAYNKLLELVSSKSVKEFAPDFICGKDNEQLDFKNYVDPHFKKTSNLLPTPVEFDKTVRCSSSSQNDGVEDSILLQDLENKFISNIPPNCFAHGNIGNNTFRWIRAMTNAASASAFICQGIDTNYNQLSHSVNEQPHQNQAINVSPTSIQVPDIANDVPFQNQHSSSYSGQALAYQNLLELGNNQKYPRILPPFVFQNQHKLFSRPKLPQFFLQQMLQQKHIIRYGHVAEASENTLHWSNSQNVSHSYAPVSYEQEAISPNSLPYGNMNDVDTYISASEPISNCLEP